jgi:HSP20 family protein
MEIRFGEFRAEIELPVAVQAEGIEAIYRDGFLRIMLPKALPRKVEIE